MKLQIAPKSKWTGVIGNCYYVSFGYSKPIIIIGPDWPFNFCILTMIFTVLITFLIVMARMVGPWMQLLGFSIILTNLISYLLTALKNPGIVDECVEDELKLEESKLCIKCKAVMIKNSQHCDECGLCIRQHDHHCPLSGKCIGEGNIIPFYVFLTTVFLAILYFAIWCVNIIVEAKRNF